MGDSIVAAALSHRQVRDGQPAESLGGFLDALIDQRNRKMADGIDARLRAHPERSFFFAIGSLHIPGPEGIEALLTKRGHTLIRVTAE